MTMISSTRALAIVEAEVATMAMAMKRGQLWSRSSETLHPGLLQAFLDLKQMLSSMNESIFQLDPNSFLSPFLDVIRSEVVTGPVTGLALSSVSKFLTYKLLKEDQPNIANAVENLADAVTHARFVGVDTSSDEIVLMKIMEVLRTLFLSPVGLLLTNESVCEIMQSIFRICFETRLTELLRKTAEHSLNDMIQLLFTRLPTFSEENLPLLKKMKMKNSHGDGSKGKKKHSRPKQAKMSQARSISNITQELCKEVSEDGTKISSNKSFTSDSGDASITSPLPISPSEPNFNVDADVLARSPIGSVSDLTNFATSDTESVEPEKPTSERPTDVETSSKSADENSDAFNKEKSCKEEVEKEDEEANPIVVTSPNGTDRPPDVDSSCDQSKEDKKEGSNEVIEGSTEEFVNSQGVTFTPTTDMIDESGTLVPYGLPCVRELFRFLVSLINPGDSHNQDSMIQIALSLLATALETGAEHLDKFESLLMLVKDELARNLVSLLSAERIGTFSSSLWISYLVFESQRKHLKYQLEIFLNKLNETVYSESQKVTYEHKELALEIIVRFYRIPGFLTQLYLNFDCGLFTSNVFEDLTKMLSKNAFPVTGLYSTHFLSLDALLTIVEEIESHCQKKNGNDTVKDEQKPRRNLETLSSTSAHTNTKIPSHEEVLALKKKKRIITTATEQFNSKPSKGLSCLQENGLIKKPLDSSEVVDFIRQNPHLCKKQIGDYISNRKNLSILEAFVKSFDFVGLRIDESLRQFLEAFRLPGEAPLITLVLEHFADHWHNSNKNVKIHDPDSAFTLSYGVIMLNVDQHNKNHTKTNDPMTEEQFKRNLRGTNNGADHDQEMLHEIYHAIKNEEIVMPAEQTGLVKENYLWKCVLKRGQDEGSEYFVAPNGYFDHDLFSIIWGPTVATLSYMFDKSQEKSVIEKALHGFQKCALIASHYHMSDVFDNLVISLCKFTTLLTVADPPFQYIPAFGGNDKALLATKTVFNLVQKHGNILRDGWKNITECLLQLFKCQLLPKSLMEAEDFVESTGRVKLFREENQVAKVESGFLTSFVSFISMSSEIQQKIRTPEEEEAAKLAAKCIKGCNLETLVTESKFLLSESLQELVKYLISGSHLDEVEDEHARLFYLEFLVRIAIQNRDRVQIIWTPVCDHLARLIMSSTGEDKSFMLERSVTALLRLAVRLSRKEDLASSVVQSLQILLAMRVNLIFHVSRHIAYGLYELLRNNAANIHEAEDWAIIFFLIEVVGAGANPNINNSDGEIDEKTGADFEAANSGNTSPIRERSESVSSGGWIVLGESGQNKKLIKPSVSNSSDLLDFNQFAIVHTRPIVMHDSISFLKCCESLAFLIRDVAHITPHNFFNCVQALRTFVEASFVSRVDTLANNTLGKGDHQTSTSRSQMKRTPPGRAPPTRNARSAPSNLDKDTDESDGEDLTTEYHHVALQLLDLMHTLHTRAGQIHKSWAEEGNNALPEDSSLWTTAWCPLLQGMSRFCCDKRSHIRTSALATLQRAFLFHDLQTLSSVEWESAFTSVLFPMLTQLLIKSNPGEKTAMEETRTRAATLIGKVFLQHLSPLSELATFTPLWLTLLDFMHQFIKAAASDLLADAVPESLKNMLLVMDTVGIFFTSEGQSTPIWSLTWEKLESFLPNLMKDLFAHRETIVKQSVVIKGTSESMKVEKPAQDEAKAPPVQPLVIHLQSTDDKEKPPEVNSRQEDNVAKPNEEPPVSPLDPPYLPASAFSNPSQNGGAESFNIAPPEYTSTFDINPGLDPVNIPSLPEIAPMPPPPVSIAPLTRPLTTEGFQPIQLATPPNIPIIPVANPTPIVAAQTSNLSQYFQASLTPGENGAAPISGNILTAAVTPTLSNQSNTMFAGSNSEEKAGSILEDEK